MRKPIEEVRVYLWQARFFLTNGRESGKANALKTIQKAIEFIDNKKQVKK